MTLLMRDQETLDKGIEIGKEAGKKTEKIQIAKNKK